MTDVLEISDKEIQIKEAIELALSQKGSILSQKKKIEYQKFTLDLTKKGMTPDVTASAGYSVYGENSLDDNGWNARVTLSMPLIDGGLTKSKIQSASKDLTSAEAEMQNIENDVKLSVRKSWYALKEAKELLVSSKEAEKVAKETLDLALERYKTGVGNSLEVSDAVDSFALAQTNTVTAMYQCKQSHLELELSIGGLELEAK